MSEPLGTLEVLERAGRRVVVRRGTSETTVNLTLDIDGHGAATVRTGVGLFDHLISSLAHHTQALSARVLPVVRFLSAPVAASIRITSACQPAQVCRQWLPT